MDCNGLKKSLFINLDGTLVGQPPSIIFPTEYDWNDQIHGVEDYQLGNLSSSDSNCFNRTTQFIINGDTITDFEPLSVIDRIELVTSPSSCREQSPCSIQPVLLAYDSSGNVINKLGSNDQPWQIIVTVVNQSNVTLIGDIANYTNRQTQFTTFGFPYMGNCQIQFSFILPDNISRYSIDTTRNSLLYTSIISVSRATLSGKQIDKISVISINETFDISVVIVDSISQYEISNIQWRSFTWSATISLYTLSEYNPQGSLTSSSVIINTTTGILTATNLSIDRIGMYILNVILTSSNGEYSFGVTTSGILVKEINNTLITDVGQPVSYIQFSGDYDALSSNNLLEIKRATIYNYLISIQLPIVSDITIYKGDLESVYSSFVVGSAPSNTSYAVQTTQSNSNAISDLSTNIIVINSRSYRVSSTSTTASSSNSGSQSYSQITNTRLIIGLVVGLVSGTILIGAMILAYRKYDKKHQCRRLFNDPEMDNTTDALTVFNNHETTIHKTLDTIKNPSASASNPPVSTEIIRVPSASLSVTSLDVT